MLVVPNGLPSKTLLEVSKHPAFNNQLSNEEMMKKWQGYDWQNCKEFTVSILIARVKTWKKLRDEYIRLFDQITKTFNHHASGQWLTAYIAHRDLEVKFLSSVFQCGRWYVGVETNVKNNQLCLDNEIVLFNHTKYLEEYSF